MPDQANYSTPPLACVALSKYFNQSKVLEDISLDFASGTIHAIIGENGAGKSTLMRILAGDLLPTSGIILVNGEEVAGLNPSLALARGIVLVHQEILLAMHLSVSQNIFLGRELYRGWLLDEKRMLEQSAALLQRLKAPIDPRQKLSSLPIAQRQLVQLARALALAHQVVIFDEPTACLSSHESDALLENILALRDSGLAIIYSSHRLEEVKAIADEVSILRDGGLIMRAPVRDMHVVDLAYAMVGREFGHLFPEKKRAPLSPIMFEVHGYNVPKYVKNAHFHVRYGEILGFAGMIGAGRTELFESLIGLRQGSGEVMYIDRFWNFHSPRQAMDQGIVYLSEDRKGKGLLLEKNLQTNLTLAALQEFCHRSVIDQGKEARALDRAFVDYDIKAIGKNVKSGQLSGGNQQKLFLAKLMLLNPQLLILDEVTRGIDMPTKIQIYYFIAAFAASGRSVIVISSETWELIGLCHRLVVMREGEIVGELEESTMQEEFVALLATGVHDKSWQEFLAEKNK